MNMTDIFRGNMRQHVVYTVKDMETGETKEIDDFRPVREGLRAPSMTGKIRIVTARVIGVY